MAYSGSHETRTRKCYEFKRHINVISYQSRKKDKNKIQQSLLYLVEDDYIHIHYRLKP
jgi:hypothetical protein